MNKPKLTGLIAAPHTPFAADGSLNLTIVEKQAEHLLDNGINIVFAAGTTGESHSLTQDERLALAQRWIEVARGTPLKVIVHVGSNCLADARVLAAQAERLGAFAIAALAPSYFKPRNIETLVACCAEIASAAPQTPFYYYDIPVLTGVNLPAAEFLERGAEHIPTLAGMKFTNGDLMAYQLCLRAGGGVFDVPYGFDEYMLGALAMGARGAVGSGFNFAGPVYARLLAAFQRGDLEAARLEQFRGVQIIQVLVGYGYMGAAKAVMAMLGVDVGPARLPNGNPTPQQVKELRAKLEAMGFFEWIRR
jgi:N-acetylneuraminate lyase